MKTAHDRAPGLLEVRHLRLVGAITSEGSVTRAAAILHLSQSAVSHQLLALESSLGTRLFDRVGKRMVPTATGQQLAAEGRRLLGELADLEHAVDGTREQRTPLRITSSCFTSYTWLPAAVAQFANSHPQIDLSIVLEATRRNADALANDEVDIAISTDPPRDATYDREVVIESEIVAVTSKRHPLCDRVKKRVLGWGALHDCRLMVPDIADEDLARLDAAVRTYWQRESGQRISQPITVRRVPISEALLELARTGAGVAIMDRWTIPAVARRALTVHTMFPAAPRVFHAVWRRANPRRLPIAELVAIVKRAATSAVGR